MSGLLGRLGSWCARHGRAVLALWVVVAALLTAGSVLFPGPATNDTSLPGTDAQRAMDLLQDGFGPGYKMGGAVQLVLYSPAGSLITEPRKSAVKRAAEQIRKVPHVVEVTPPSRTGGLAPSLEVGFIAVKLEGHDTTKTVETAKLLVEAAEPARAAGLEVVPAGSSSPANKEIKTGTSEIIGVICALLVLLFAFGTLVAAMIPIFVALVSIATGLGTIGLLGHLVDVPKQAPILATMIGLGVGIDYALFLLSRYRKLLADGVPVHEAVRRMVAGSGGAVVFAGGTVIIALSALLLADFPMLQTLGWITGISVVCAVLTAVTLVPALLGMLGHRVNAFRLPFVGRRGSRGSSGWASLGNWVARRPWSVLALSLVLLGALTAPALGLKLGTLDNGYGDRGTDARRSYELLQAGFGPGMNGPLVVVADLETPVVDRKPAPAILRNLKERVADVEGVAHVGDPVLNERGTAALVQAIPDYAPSDPRALEVVKAVRALEIEGAKVHVGGEVAGMADANSKIAARTPLVVGVVVLLSALLLLLAFRSPVVAIKAAVMNLISLGAAFGALSLVFSLGLGSGLVGMDPPVNVDASYLSTIFFTVPIDSYIPLMLFAILFGLSMDYEVFLLTAVRQAYLRHGDNRRAVAEGLGSTGRVITSAALIMVSVFVAFIAYPDPMVKIFGVGLAVAIAVDATIIRGLLVPATMVLLGRFNWWCPAWLDRLLPNLSIEGQEEDEETEEPEEPSRELVGAGRG
ncbi:MMPL family transporter [Streptosporangium sp. NBC_01755]|uniref:MMPL family transporter n=1 Tax=unclassified Streptosporangium TaxID=2632669 RepID=UPI002DDAC798|nr:MULTISPECIES: MMPL family transporter [unclassified Streptosporangium]WSA23566.1 MMPL family transporter [Streptosporangium sp. NBC_01810]WSC98224.1 MMPL family transporter [Streptosporangium sp. NBC_01755]